MGVRVRVPTGSETACRWEREADGVEGGLRSEKCGGGLSNIDEAIV